MEDNFEWDSDDDPYKDIDFLHVSNTRVLAYHLNRLKVQDLGSIYLHSGDYIKSSFPYTPCWMGELSENN